MGIRKYIRPALGVIFLIIGIVSNFLPVIPVLGILGLFIGAFLLAPYVPFFEKAKEWLKSKDRSGKTVQAEKKIENAEEKKKKERKEDQ